MQYIINQKNEIRDDFNNLFDLLAETEERISLQIEEHDEKIESYVECLEQINESIDRIRIKLDV